MAILVTGGAGFIGAHTSIELLKNNEIYREIASSQLSDEEIEEKLKKFRAFLLVNMIDGKVSYYCSNFEKVKFEEDNIILNVEEIKEVM